MNRFLNMTIRSILIMYFFCLSGSSLAQVTPYVLGGLNVDVFASHPCDGANNGQLVLTLNSANGGTANYTIIGPTAALVISGPIIVGTPVIFNTDPGSLPAGDYDFIFSDGVNVINTFVPQGGNTLTLQDLTPLTIIDNSSDNTSCISPNGELNLDFTGGSLDLPGGGILNYSITASNGNPSFPITGTYTGTSIVIPGLAGGDYIITVDDSLSVCGIDPLFDPTATIEIEDPVPNTYSILAPFVQDVCEDGDATFTLNASDGSVNYQVVVLPGQTPLTPNIVEPGTGGAINFTVPAFSLTDGVELGVLARSGLCTSILMNNSVTVGIDLNPDIGLAVTPLAATICEGDNGTIQVIGSEVGVNYQLRDDFDDSTIGGPEPGNGGIVSLSAGALTTTTTFNVLALSGVCTPVELTATATITVDLLPDASLGVIAQDDPICENTSTNILVANSENGFSYQLRNDADDSPIGTPVLGDGNTISLSTGNLTASTTFNVLVTNGVCPPIQLTQLATVSVDPEPDLNLAVLANPTSVCEGDFSIVSVQNSEVGVIYELRNGTTVIGAPQGGNTGQLDFNTGTLSANTTFNILATRGACQVQLNNTATVTVNPLPDGTLSSTSPICAGGTSDLTFTASVGTGPFDLVVEGVAYNNVTSGVSFAT
ncbi:MAG: hypothetical protein AAGF85_04365, partial [Bacteroidota bacterium]